MKIALTGAHGVGKSTLANFLQKKLQQLGRTVIITPEVPRLICDHVEDMQYFRRSNNTFAKQALILLGQLVIECQGKNSEIQICDRTLFDHWAYTLHAFRDELAAHYMIEPYEWFIAQHCKLYDHIFYIPNEIEPIDDGTRESDLGFQSEIDGLIKGLLEQHRLKYTILTGSVEERANMILSLLNIL